MCFIQLENVLAGISPSLLDVSNSNANYIPFKHLFSFKFVSKWIITLSVHKISAIKCLLWFLFLIQWFYLDIYNFCMLFHLGVALEGVFYEAAFVGAQGVYTWAEGVHVLFVDAT